MTTVADKLAPRLNRPLFVFTVPEAEREWETDPTSFALQQPTLLQEMDAGRVADPTAPLTYVYALIERSIVQINGQPADQGKPLLDDVSPKVRRLMQDAYDSINSPSAQGRKDFLASVKKIAG